MELAQRPTNGRTNEHVLPDGWPEVIRTKVFYGPEENHWFALDADFDIASMGSTADEALVSLQRMVCAYLTSYLHEGRDFDSARRPIPPKLRAKLQAQVFLAKPMRALRRGADTTQEGDFLFPAGWSSPARC